MLDIGSKRPSVLVPLLNSQQNICIRYASGYAYGVACIKRVCIRVCIWCCMYRKGMHQGTPVSSHQGICILLC